MKNRLIFFALFAIQSCLGCANAQSREAIAAAGYTAMPGVELHLATRGHDATYYAVWRKDAIATVVLFSGGSGGYGHVAASLDNWPSSNNFLVRSVRIFAGKPLNVVLYGVADDLTSLSSSDRVGEAHQTDVKNLLTTLKTRSPAPIWLIGTSRGTLTAAEATVRNQTSLVSGLILTSAVTAGKQLTIYTAKLSSITVPVMVMYHDNDTCVASPAGNATAIETTFRSAADKKTVSINGGSPGMGDVCGALASHGYPGKERETIDIMCDWIASHPAKIE
jgi:dienelactone hydrolase